jgi:hypothetical protein
MSPSRAREAAMSRTFVSRGKRTPSLLSSPCMRPSGSLGGSRGRARSTILPIRDWPTAAAPTIIIGLRRLESLVIEKGAASRKSLSARAAAWGRAARATPHNAPITLANDPRKEQRRHG